MKSLYIFIMGTILTLLPHYSFAFEHKDKETDTNVIGHVTEKHTKEHMPYVVIQLAGTTIGTSTDDTGHYFLKNLPEAVHIALRGAGYIHQVDGDNALIETSVELVASVCVSL